jgi:hypothetical protein
MRAVKKGNFSRCPYARRNGKSVQTLLEEFVRKILKTIDRSR